MFSLFAHIHAHAKSQKHYESKEIKVKNYNLSRRSFIGIIESLHSTIKKQNWHTEKTEWGNYYSDTNYSESSFEQKKKIISLLLERINPKSLWDIGSNTGVFSRISSKKGIQTVSFDVDPVAVEKNFIECIEKKDMNLLPLLIDLTNPSPDIGWHNQERTSFIKRGPADVILALALIHHLAISNNVPLDMIAEFFAKNCNHLIIEFVPKEDSQVKRLLATREDVFTDYTQDNFEVQFKKVFTIQEKIKIDNSMRTIYYMQKILST
jgi:ribosomal protein L11 methylase PrmA